MTALQDTRTKVEPGKYPGYLSFAVLGVLGLLLAAVYVTDLGFCGSPTQGALKWRGGALVQLGPTPTEPLGTQKKMPSHVLVC